MGLAAKFGQEALILSDGDGWGEGVGGGGDYQLVGTCTCERGGLVSLALEGGGGGWDHGVG